MVFSMAILLNKSDSVIYIIERIKSKVKQLAVFAMINSPYAVMLRGGL
jgi:hypothetical protein